MTLEELFAAELLMFETLNVEIQSFFQAKNEFYYLEGSHYTLLF